MRRPKPIKNSKTIAKRFKITGSGKIMRHRAGKRHLLRRKDAKRKRRLGTDVEVDRTDTQRVVGNLPFK